MTTTQPQRTPASDMFPRHRDRDRPPSRFKTRHRKRKRSRSEKKSKKNYTPPLYSWIWGEDWTVDKQFQILIWDLFAKYVGTMRVGKEGTQKYELWTWKGTQSDIRKIQLQLSWVMGTRSLDLNNPSDLLREIVCRYRENFPSDSPWTFDRLYGDVRYSIPKPQE